MRRQDTGACPCWGACGPLRTTIIVPGPAAWSAPLTPMELAGRFRLRGKGVCGDLEAGSASGRRAHSAFVVPCIWSGPITNFFRNSLNCREVLVSSLFQTYSVRRPFSAGSGAGSGPDRSAAPPCSRTWWASSWTSAAKRSAPGSIKDESGAGFCRPWPHGPWPTCTDAFPAPFQAGRQRHGRGHPHQPRPLHPGRRGRPGRGRRDAAIIQIWRWIWTPVSVGSRYSHVEKLLCAA